MSVLLGGPHGAIVYKIKEDMKEVVMDDFIMGYVTPGITQVMGPKIGLLLSRALLWASVGLPDRVPAGIKRCILTHLVQVGGDAEINPIIFGRPLWPPALAADFALLRSDLPRATAATTR